MSDSSYIAVTNHRRPFDTSGRPPALELVDDEWAADVLEEEDLPTKTYEVPLMGEDDYDNDGEPAVVVTTGTSSSAVTNMEERRRREEGWNDLGLDQLDQRGPEGGSSSGANHHNNGGNSQ
jgi:hypothetical protein